MPAKVIGPILLVKFNYRLFCVCLLTIFMLGQVTSYHTGIHWHCILWSVVHILVNGQVTTGILTRTASCPCQDTILEGTFYRDVDEYLKRVILSTKIPSVQKFLFSTKSLPYTHLQSDFQLNSCVVI